MNKHPKLHVVHATCATCGAEHTLGTAATSVAIDVCPNCHPAYTGRDLNAARGDRVERFNRRRMLAA
jgi:large subunit ribosomal protein L31